MLLGIDHLVIAVHDPAAAADRMEAVLGLSVTGGGEHDGAGTWNRLAFLGDTYLELIGVRDRPQVEANEAFAVGRAALRVLDERREGLATFALASDDVAGDVERLRAAGASIAVPVPGSRTRPDGGVVRWRTAFPSLGPDQPPFLIEHDAAGAEWDEEARRARALFRHPVGGRVRLVGLRLAVASTNDTAAAFRTTLGLSDAGGSIRVGGQRIVLVDGASEPATVELQADPGTPPLDADLFGIRWIRHAREGPGDLTSGSAHPERDGRR
jgi:catechol 2,3-dioxygenase-like lactoylglutathione lyase family enzyme